LIDFYAQKVGGEPFSSHALATFPDLDIGQLRRLQRQYWNAFKHATHLSGQERDDDELLSRFTDVQNDHVLFIGWYDYALVADAMPVEAQVHQIWYLALYPEKLDPAISAETIQSAFPNLRSFPRDQQKRLLLKRIKMAKSDAELMNDPKTENRPLIIGWP